MEDSLLQSSEARVENGDTRSIFWEKSKKLWRSAFPATVWRVSSNDLSEARVDDDDTKSVRSKVWEESKKLWRTTFPAIVSKFSAFGLLVVTQAFIGHVSELDLAAYSLTQTLTMRFTIGTLLGMSSATETLCGQAFGAKQYHMLGIYLQRSWIINVTTATILLPIFIFTEQIFKLLGQEDTIAVESGNISLWFIPTLYSFAFNFTIQQFLQAQIRNRVVMWISTFTFGFHILISWIFVIKLGWGVSGAMGAYAISSWLIVAYLLVYVLCGWCSDTWKGFGIAAFTDLFPLLKLSISSGVMLCLELWYTSILVLVAGYMTNAVVAISAFSICLTIVTWEFTISIGFQIGASVRVSNELGRGDAKVVKFAIKTILCTSTVIGVFFSILCFVFGKEIAYSFTSNEEIIQAVSSLSVPVTLTILLNSVQAVLSGIAVGSGRQSMVAYVNLCTYYVIGIPLGAVLAYVADMKVKGLWIGMMGGVGVQTAVLGYITWRTDWDRQVRTALERLNKWFRPPSEEEGQSNGVLFNEGSFIN